MYQSHVHISFYYDTYIFFRFLPWEEGGTHGHCPVKNVNFYMEVPTRILFSS